MNVNTPILDLQGKLFQCIQSKGGSPEAAYVCIVNSVKVHFRNFIEQKNILRLPHSHHMIGY